MINDNMSEARQRQSTVHVYVDFDGTIAPHDPTDALFARFADPRWQEIEREWQEGRLTSQECMSRQVRLIRARPSAIAEFLETVGIDPDFPAFVDMCRAAGAEVTVVSDGLDLIVRTVLRTAGLDLPFFANALVWQGGNRWELGFPHFKTDCRVRMGNCKCGHASFDRMTAVMVGDGRSDFCIAERAALVVAKGRLAEHCRAQRLPHAEFVTFAEANTTMTRWLAHRPGENTDMAMGHRAVA